MFIITYQQLCLNETINFSQYVEWYSACHILKICSFPLRKLNDFSIINFLPSRDVVEGTFYRGGKSNVFLELLCPRQAFPAPLPSHNCAHVFGTYSNN